MDNVIDKITASYPSFRFKVSSSNTGVDIHPVHRSDKTKVVYYTVIDQEEDYLKLSLSIDNNKPLVLLNKVKNTKSELNKITALVQDIDRYLLKINNLDVVKLNYSRDGYNKLNSRTLSLIVIKDNAIENTTCISYTLSPIYVESLRSKLLKLWLKSDNVLQ